MRRESRRQVREQTAAEIAAMKTPSPTWSQVKDTLDEAMESLSDTERSALLLRFFENRSLREVGASLGISEDTAQKRVSRALDRLRELLLRRGVAVSAAGLATDLSAHAIEAAPAAVGKGITAAVSSAGGAIGAALVQSSHSAMAVFASKAAAAVVLAATLGFVALQTTMLAYQRSELAAQPAQIDAFRATLRRLHAEQQTARRRLADARTGLASPALVRSPSDPEVESAIDGWLLRLSRLKRLAHERLEMDIPHLAVLTESEWLTAAREAKLNTEEEIRDTFRGLHATARNILARALSRALQSYADAHNGQLPEHPQELAPFMDRRVPQAVLAYHEMLQTGAISAVPRDELILAERGALPDSGESRLIVSTHERGTENFNEVSARQLRQALRAFAAAQNGQLPITAADLVPYFKMKPEPRALQAFLAKPARDFAPEALQKLLSR